MKKREKQQIARQVIIGLYKKEKEHEMHKLKKSEVSGEQFKCWKKKIKN